MPGENLLERRGRAMGPTYRLFYENPVHLVRGKGVSNCAHGHRE